METGSDRAATDLAAELAQYLTDQGAVDVSALDISRHSSFADAFVIAGATSTGHLQGLYRRAVEFLGEHGYPVRRRNGRNDESGWLLLDSGNLVTHLMLPEQRSFYELEKLWFDAPPIGLSGENS